MLKISKLGCERDDRCLFESLDYVFLPGTVTQLEGPNGAGKTTLLRILAGLFTSYTGEVYWQDVPLSQTRIDYTSQLLFIGHKSSVKLSLTPIENLRFLIGIHQPFSEIDLQNALAKVGLYGFEDVLCRNLSAGQQRRVALARLYLTQAKLWILDEVFTAIDKQGVAQLEAFLAERAREGVTIILTTHHQLAVPGLNILSLGGPMHVSSEPWMEHDG